MQFHILTACLFALPTLGYPIANLAQLTGPHLSHNITAGPPDGHVISDHYALKRKRGLQ